MHIIIFLRNLLIRLPLKTHDIKIRQCIIQFRAKLPNIAPCNFRASVFTLMGIDPQGTLPHPVLGDIPMLPSLGKEGQSNGILKEIMP